MYMHIDLVYTENEISLHASRAELVTWYGHLIDQDHVQKWNHANKLFFRTAGWFCLFFTGMGDVDHGDLPMEVALDDHKRVHYLQRHIATLKESREYESYL